jgi:hypothetical protein
VVQSTSEYKIDEGLQDVLGLALEHRLAARIARWQKQVADGVIDAEARQVFIAFGWITPRDVRVNRLYPKGKAKVNDVPPATNG